MTGKEIIEKMGWINGDDRNILHFIYCLGNFSFDENIPVEVWYEKLDNVIAGAIKYNDVDALKIALSIEDMLKEETNIHML